MKPSPALVGRWFRTGPHSEACVFLGIEDDGGVAMAHRLKDGLGDPFKVPPGRFDSDGWYEVPGDDTGWLIADLEARLRAQIPGALLDGYQRLATERAQLRRDTGALIAALDEALSLIDTSRGSCGKLGADRCDGKRCTRCRGLALALVRNTARFNMSSG